MKMRMRAGIVLGVVGAWVAAGCGSSHPVYKASPGEQVATASRLPVEGTWSRTRNGLRCRMLLSAATVSENGKVTAAIEVQNVTRDKILLQSKDLPPFSGNIWLDENRAVIDGSSVAQTIDGAHLQIGPFERIILSPCTLTITASAGTHRVAGDLYVHRESTPGGLAAPPVEIEVLPAPRDQQAGVSTAP